MFQFLIYVAKGSSILNIRVKQTILNRISNLARVNLTHTLGALTSHSQATVCFSFRFVDQRHSPRLQRTALLCTRGLLCNIKLTSYHYERVGGMSICRAEELLDLPLTHNSRHVASTFKRLTTATTHCSLIKFINTDGLQQIRP